jgi:hypothetical protein
MEAGQSGVAEISRGKIVTAEVQPNIMYAEPLCASILLSIYALLFLAIVLGIFLLVSNGAKFSRKGHTKLWISHPLLWSIR